MGNFFVPCDLQIWQRTLKNHREPLLRYFKICAWFHNHRSIQTGVTVQKYQILVKVGSFVLCDLEICRMTLKSNRAPPLISFKQALCIILQPSVYRKWSYSLKTFNWGQNRRFFVLCDFEIWQMTLKHNRTPSMPNQAFCIISSPYVNSN